MRHIHTPEDKEIDGVRYLNTGDWIENTSYVMYETKSFDPSSQKLILIK